MKQTIKILERTAEILTENQWTQFQWAKTTSGRPTTLYAPDACQFCLTGALRRAIHDIKGVKFPHSLNPAGKELCMQMHIDHNIHYGLTVFNDKKAKNKEDVLKLINNTIKRLKKRQKELKE